MRLMKIPAGTRRRRRCWRRTRRSNLSSAWIVSRSKSIMSPSKKSDTRYKKLTPPGAVHSLVFGAGDRVRQLGIRRRIVAQEYSLSAASEPVFPIGQSKTPRVWLPVELGIDKEGKDEKAEEEETRHGCRRASPGHGVIDSSKDKRGNGP